jgi:LysM repeat protein
VVLVVLVVLLAVVMLLVVLSADDTVAVLQRVRGHVIASPCALSVAFCVALRTAFPGRFRGRTDVRDGSSGVATNQTPVRLDSERVFVVLWMDEQVFAIRLRGFLSQGPGRMIAMTAVAFAQQQFSFPPNAGPQPAPVMVLVPSMADDVRPSMRTTVDVLPMPPRSVPRRAVHSGSTSSRSTNIAIAAPRSSTSPVWLVRLALVAAVTVLAAVGLFLATGNDGRGSTVGPASAVVTPAAVDGSAAVHVVQPGDTLWSIAAVVAPGSDPRPIVDELARRSGGAGLQPGQRIALEGLGR